MNKDDNQEFKPVSVVEILKAKHQTYPPIDGFDVAIGWPTPEQQKQLRDSIIVHNKADIEEEEPRNQERFEANQKFADPERNVFKNEVADVSLTDLDEFTKITQEAVKKRGWDNPSSLTGPSRHMNLEGNFVYDVDSLTEFLDTPLKPKMLSAGEFLQKCLEILDERGKQRDAPDNRERSMKKIVTMFNIYADTRLTVEQGWMFMAILKMVRSNTGKYNEDSYVDGANYIVLAAEEAAATKGQE